MKLIHSLFLTVLIIALPSTCSQANNDSINIQIKTKSLNTVFDNANNTFNNINEYLSNLPTIPNAIMQLGLTASGIILLYKGSDILQNCANNLSNKTITTEDPSFFWSGVFGGSMVLMGLTTTISAIKMTKILLNQ